MSSVNDVQQLTRCFGEVTAVDHVSFDVASGEIFGFLGSNGAGKSTTVRMLTGVMDPIEGTAAIRGHDIKTEPLGAREHLGIVPEEANVYLELSVWQNMMLMAELHDVPRQRRKHEGKRLLEELNLADRKKDKARTLSKGLRQRLMLCSALVSEPEILFLDEPTGGLDVHSARLMHDIIQKTRERGLTVFLTTHNMAEAEQLCDRVAIISRGQIVAVDSPEQLRDRMKSSQYVSVAFDGGSPSKEELEAVPGVSSLGQTADGIRLYTDNPGSVATELVKLSEQQNVPIKEIATCKPALEDVFLQLTTAKEDAV